MSPFDSGCRISEISPLFFEIEGELALSFKSASAPERTHAQVWRAVKVIERLEATWWS